MAQYKVQVNDTSAKKKGSRTMFIILGVLILMFSVTVAVAVPLALQGSTTDVYMEAANKLLDEVPIIDGHNDWAWQLRDHRQNVINNISLSDDFTKYYPISHTDIKRLRTGKVGAQFWACFVRCSSMHKDAVRQGLEQMDMIRRIVEKDPATFVLTTTADEIETAIKDKKIASLIGVEGGHMIDSSLAALRMYFALGARYMTLTHSCNTPWANSSYSKGGLTDFGKLVVKEMNRLGMLIDISHVSDEVMHDVFDNSQAPVIFSHSSARALCDHPRNVPDDLLLRLKQNAGILMINFYNDYVTCNQSANISDVADHYDYVKALIGADYIGVGADYDGVTRVPEGLEDVSKYPWLIAELMKRGWSDEDLKKVTGRNILRVMRKTEEVARQLQGKRAPEEAWIPPEDVAQFSTCRS